MYTCRAPRVLAWGWDPKSASVRPCCKEVYPNRYNCRFRCCNFYLQNMPYLRIVVEHYHLDSQTQLYTGSLRRTVHYHYKSGAVRYKRQDKDLSYNKLPNSFWVHLQEYN